MVTVLVLVLVALMVAGAVLMVVQAFRGCFLSTVWVCCGGLTSAAELVGTLIVAACGSIAGND